MKKITTLDLPRYAIDNCCPKCGGGAAVRYEPNLHYHGAPIGRGEVREPDCCSFEHLLRTCHACRYQWAEAPFAAKGARPSDPEDALLPSGYRLEVFAISHDGETVSCTVWDGMLEPALRHRDRLREEAQWQRVDVRVRRGDR